MSTYFATRLPKMATFFVTIENKKNEMTAVEKSLVARIFHFFVIFASNSRCCHFVFLFFLIFDPLVVFRDVFSHFFDILENQHETGVFSNPIVPFLATTNEKKNGIFTKTKNQKGAVDSQRKRIGRLWPEDLSRKKKSPGKGLQKRVLCVHLFTTRLLTGVVLSLIS